MKYEGVADGVEYWKLVDLIEHLLVDFWVSIEESVKIQQE